MHSSIQPYVVLLVHYYLSFTILQSIGEHDTFGSVTTTMEGMVKQMWKCIRRWSYRPEVLQKLWGSLIYLVYGCRLSCALCPWGCPAPVWNRYDSFHQHVDNILTFIDNSEKKPMLCPCFGFICGTLILLCVASSIKTIESRSELMDFSESMQQTCPNDIISSLCDLNINHLNASDYSLDKLHREMDSHHIQQKKERCSEEIQWKKEVPLPQMQLNATK